MQILVIIMEYHVALFIRYGFLNVVLLCHKSHESLTAPYKYIPGMPQLVSMQKGLKYVLHLIAVGPFSFHPHIMA